MRVLVLEDDPDLSRSLSRFLRHAGYVVDEAGDLSSADIKLSVNDYDIAVFDRSVPGGDSVELVRRLRVEGKTLPVLFLTALDSIASRVEGLRAGGDDYLVKPFAMDELVARVHVLARRRAVNAAQATLSVADLCLDPERNEATRNGVPLDLTAKEFVLLRYLMTRHKSVVSRSELIEHCWDEMAEPMSNVVDVRLGALRRKLGEPPLLHTIRGVGFLLEDRENPSGQP